MFVDSYRDNSFVHSEHEIAIFSNRKRRVQGALRE